MFLHGLKITEKSIIQWLFLASFWKPEACGQTVLPDMSILLGQKLVEMAKLKWDIFDDFQTLLNRGFYLGLWEFFKVDFSSTILILSKCCDI